MGKRPKMAVLWEEKRK